jgi:hypothetical protein
MQPRPVTLVLLLRRRIRDGWAGWIGFGNVSGPDSNYSDATIFALAEDRWRAATIFFYLLVYTRFLLLQFLAEQFNGRK